jgi:hypothetical protein
MLRHRKGPIFCSGCFLPGGKERESVVLVVGIAATEEFGKTEVEA